MRKKLTEQPSVYQWALPPKLDVPRDKLKIRLDFYESTLVMSFVKDKIITTKMVSPEAVALALLSDIPLNSGILPENTIWWRHLNNGLPEMALLRPPKIWPVALQLKAFEQPRRFKLPMPGLLFLCQSGSPPSVFAVKKRPETSEEPVFRAPLYNVYNSGATCPGSHKYNADVSKIPEEFFMSFFTQSLAQNISHKYKSDLLSLWESLDGKNHYPLKDLVPYGVMGNLMKGGKRY